MKRVVLMLVLAVLAVLALSAGCTGSSPATTPTPTATPATTVPTPTQTVSLQPEPTDVMPADYKVAAQVQKDPIYRGITVTFSGGLGQENVKEFTATVIRSDGTTETKSLTKPSGKSLSKGESLEFTGTAGDDRVQVWVVMDRPLGKDAMTKFTIWDSVLGPKGTR